MNLVGGKRSVVMSRYVPKPDVEVVAPKQSVNELALLFPAQIFQRMPEFIWQFYSFWLKNFADFA